MTEGIRITTNNFKYAAWYLRLAALAVDKILILTLVLLIVPGSGRVMTLLAGGNWQEAFYFLGTFDGVWLVAVLPVYFVVMWGLFSRTLGMMLLKISIVDYNGARLGWVTAVLRLFGFYLCWLPLGLGFLPVLLNKKRQGLHDKLTKTLVVVKR